MSNYLNATLNSHSGQLAEHIPSTFNDSASWRFPDHENHVTTPSVCITPGPSIHTINAPPSLPSRRPKHARRRDPNHVRRPRNAFILFRSSYVKSVEASVQPQQNELSKLAANVWNNMSAEERQPFCELAAMEKEEHYAKYPDYVYSPGKSRTKSAGPQEKAPTSFEHTSPSTSPPPSTPGEISSLNDQIKKFPSFEREPPSPFHAHLDHVTGQFAYQDYNHDFMSTSVPILPRAASTSSCIDSTTSYLPSVSGSNAFACPYPPGPSSLSWDTYHDNYLASLPMYTFPEGGLEGDVLLEQFVNDLTKQMELTNTAYDFSSMEYQESDGSVYQFFDFSIDA